MRTLNLGGSAIALSVMTFLAGCGASGNLAPTNSALVTAPRGQSWIAPDAKRGGLLYVSDLNTGNVEVFSYPGGKLKGTIAGFSAPHGLCVDKAGDVFVTSTTSSQIFEYAHGSIIPKAKLSDDGYQPNGCSVDPTTGDLAVANIFAAHSGGGSVSIFKHAAGKPKIYQTPDLFAYYFCGYDTHGNLFVDGTTYHASFVLAELPAGSKSLTNISLDQQIRFPSGVQWDGQHLAVGDQYNLSGPSVIYEFSISGSQGTKVGTTPLSDSCDVLQFWIQGKRVVAPNDCSPYVKYFAYPAGGISKKSISDPNQPVGVTVSYK